MTTPDETSQLTPDFDRLVQQAYPDSDTPALEQESASAEEVVDPPISIAALDDLWTAFLGLDEWLFLARFREGADDFPLIAAIDGQLWMFLFTDFERLRRFADAQGILDPAQNAHFISMSPADSVAWLERLHSAQPTAPDQQSLHGVRINEGPHGWFAPIESLPAIIGHLKELGRLITDTGESDGSNPAAPAEPQNLDSERDFFRAAGKN